MKEHLGNMIRWVTELHWPLQMGIFYAHGWEWEADSRSTKIIPMLYFSNLSGRDLIFPNAPLSYTD